MRVERDDRADLGSAAGRRVGVEMPAEGSDAATVNSPPIGISSASAISRR
jgi:hypothetical protein